jgi:hypothetical protein
MEDTMKSLSALLGAIVLTAVVLSVSAPASALGGCGRNGHRDGYGRCVFGGQNEDYCIRTKGHPAVRMPNGTFRCI